MRNQTEQGMLPRSTKIMSHTPLTLLDKSAGAGYISEGQRSSSISIRISNPTSDSNPSLQARRILLVTLTLVLTYLSWISLIRSIADFYADNAESWLNYWRAHKMLTVPTQDWETAYGTSLRAIALDPGNARHEDILSQMMMWRLSDPALAKSERTRIMSEGMKHARRNTAGRPAWPYAWAGLLQWKAVVAEIDDEFRLALERSSTLGPWETPVQRIVVQIGAAYWDKLNETDKSRVLDAAKRGLEQQEKEMAAVITKTGLGDAVCATLTLQTELANRYCESGS